MYLFNEYIFAQLTNLKMTLQIIHISDTHISKDEPQRLKNLENCVHAINALDETPDLVVHTGDITHHALPQEYHNARQLLDELKAPYFVMAGNKDKRPELLTEFSDSRYQLPMQGWVQYSIEHYPVRLLMLDTVSDNSNKGKLCSERLEHLERMLAADTTKPVALFLHHTPFEAVGIPDPYQYEDWDDVDKLAKVLSKFPNVTGIYCGHVHRFIDGEIAGIKASAISCLAADLRKGEITDEERRQPVFKLLSLRH